MKKAPSPPPAPDPQTTANAQTQSNLQTAIGNARLNRVNQTTPWGSINYTEGTPDANGVPSYSANIQLSPQQQALLDQQQQMQLQRGDIAQSLMGRVGSNLAQPLNLSNLASVNNRGQMYTGAVNAQPQRGAPPPPNGPPPGQGGDQQMQGLMRLLSSLPPGALQQLMGGSQGGNPSQGAGSPQIPGATPAPQAGPTQGPSPAMSSTPFSSYDQYAQYMNTRGNTPLSETLWNDPQASKWNAVGNLMDLSPGDPRYDEVKQAILAAHPGSDVRSVALSSVRGGADKGKTVRLPDGSYAWSVDNSVQPKDSDNWKMAAAGIGTVLGGAALGGAMGLGGEGAAEAGASGAFDMGGSQGVFDAAGNPLYTSPAAGSAPGGAFDMGGSQGVFDSSGNPQYTSPRGGLVRNLFQGNTPWSGNGYNPLTFSGGDRATTAARLLPSILRLLGTQQRSGQ